jgi:hypothetical protein
VGSTLLVFGLYFSIAAVSIINVEGKHRRTTWVVSIISGLLLGLICCPLALLAAGYSNSSFVTTGLSVENGILLIEASAVLFETFLLYGLSKRALPLVQTAVISLTANLTSFAFGLFFYNPWT